MNGERGKPMKKMMTGGIVIGTAVFFLLGLVWAQEKGKSMEQPSMPAASGTALWEYLKKVDYAKTWPMWPGTQALYPGKSPHGAFLTTYVNQPAYEAIEKKTGSMPYGAIVCKQNFDKDKRYVALTVMYKVKGYNPMQGDYFWAKYSQDGKIDGEGKISGCINCHSHQRGNDFVFTSSLK
jgi:hypothetical protein